MESSNPFLLNRPLTRAAVGIDILNSEDNIKKLVDAAGGDWSVLQSDWNIINSHVQSLSKSIGTPTALKSIIESKISDIVDAPTLKQFGTDVKELLTEQTGWSQVKRGGKTMVPAGDATAAFSRLDTALQSLGIHIVPVGELENFVKSVPGHGPKWAEGVFSARLHEDASNHEALNYVSNLVKR